MTEEEKFFEFVNKQIELLQKYSEIKNDDLKFSDLNKLLGNYERILFSLISLEVYAQIEYDKEKEKFDDWHAEVYLKIRHRENRAEVVATKWISMKELEMMARVENRREYNYMQENLNISKGKLEFVHRMLDGWKDQSFILNTLSKNVQTEVMSSIKSSND